MGLNRAGGCHTVAVTVTPHEATLPRGKAAPEVLYAILTEEKPNQKEQIRIKTESLRKYFPRNYSAQQMEREIIKLLEARYRAKDRGDR